MRTVEVCVILFLGPLCMEVEAHTELPILATYREGSVILAQKVAKDGED